MTRKLVSLLTIIGLVAGVGFISANAAIDNPAFRKVDRVGNYSFPPNRRKLVAMGDIMDMSVAEQKADRAIPVPQPLGFAARSAGISTSPGFTVDKSFNDDQFFPSTPRTVDFRGTPDVHFVYSDVVTTNSLSSFGYNVYDPLAGSWPQGAEVGCAIQTADADGRWVAMDVSSSGFVVIAGVDDASGTLDNHFYYQGSQFSCFWGAGTVILPSQYRANFMDPTKELHHPRIEVQEWNGDVITHVIAVEDSPTDLGAGFGDFAANSLNYFRKFGSTVAGAWEGPITLDSVNKSSGRQNTNIGSISASRVSPKVAVVYTHYHAEAFAHVAAGNHTSAQARYDNEIFYRENDSIGEPASWSPIINATNYSRIVPSATAFIEVTSVYDSDDFLHAVWGAGLTVDTVYDDPGYFWGDFSQSMYHWSNRTGAISKVVNADFGIAVNTQVCGFPGPGKSYVGDYSISECDGNLYAICTYNLDFLGILGTTVSGQIDDCTSLGARGFSANGEVVMSVSSTLDGLLWDAVRNITQSYTPGCDSSVASGGNGICQNDNLPSISRYGMDETAMAASFGALTWPASSALDLSPAQNYAGNSYLQLFYLNDEIPGPGWRPDASGNPDTATYNGLSFNPLKWVRLACVDPVTAPQIFLSSQQTGFPEQTDHGVQRNITVTVTNEGNTGLNITTIGFVETSSSAGINGWLDVSIPALSVPAGASNTGTFDVIINKAGIINNVGTIASVSGEVYLLSDAPAPRDSVSFFVNNFIIGPVAPLVWDSVSTGSIQLTASSNGDLGNSGLGGANMDYTAAALDCDDTQDTYLFDGSPVIIQKIDSAAGIFKLSTNLFTGGFGPDYAFKPVTGGTAPGSFVGPGVSDAMNTGTFVNWDSSIAVEQTFYAPTSGAPNDDFIIMKTVFSSNDGLDHANLLIGDVFDWDVPSDDGAANVAGIMGKTVYLRGIDTAVTPGCQLFANRFAGSTFLGMYSADEFTADACANDNALQGAYASVNGADNLEAQGAPNGALDSVLAWNSGSSLTGQWNLTPDTLDQRINQTYVWDYTLGATNSLTVYTALTTVLNGTVTDLDDNVKAACDWYATNLRPGCSVCSCCKGVTGNVDNDPNDISDITDLTVLIDHLFINFPVLDCPAEANVDGDLAGLVDITDLTFLIDHLFINFPENSPCQ